MNFCLFESTRTNYGTKSSCGKLSERPKWQAEKEIRVGGNNYQARVKWRSVEEGPARADN